MERQRYEYGDKLEAPHRSFIDTHPGFVYLLIITIQLIALPILIGQYALFAGPGMTFTSDLHGVLAWVGVIADFAIHPLVVYYFNSKGVFDE